MTLSKDKFDAVRRNPYSISNMNSLDRTLQPEGLYQQYSISLCYLVVSYVTILTLFALIGIALEKLNH